MKAARGLCGECWFRWRLRRDGKLMAHTLYAGSEGFSCVGAGSLPATRRPAPEKRANETTVDTQIREAHERDPEGMLKAEAWVKREQNGAHRRPGRRG